MARREPVGQGSRLTLPARIAGKGRPGALPAVSRERGWRGNRSRAQLAVRHRSAKNARKSYGQCCKTSPLVVCPAATHGKNLRHPFIHRSFSIRQNKGSVRVLLVEDEARVAGFIAKGLREQAYAVDIAPDGEQALYLAAVNQYDLVILDVMLPLKDGHAVCRELRAAGFRRPSSC